MASLTVSVTMPDGNVAQVAVSAEAQEAVRFAFDPSGLGRVRLMKALAAALIAVCRETAIDKPSADYELREAVAHTRTASMWAVSGATKGL
jgi:hypothetical protein